MTELEKKRLDVLEKLKGILEELEVPCAIREPDEGFPMHMLATLHQNIGYMNNEVMGQFYFLPLEQENQKFHYFTSVMTLDEEVPMERYQDMALAAAMLNFYLPLGAFVAEKDGGILAFKYTSILPMDAGTDEMVSLIDGNIGAALNLTNEYVDPFMRLLNGEITLDEFELELPDAHFED
ncbi:MAG: hypothetical protein LUE96_02990 [Lachnospiraceae bacterium]|nr:hypothetical protein [Lachnospiraceae bacterium]